VPESQFFDKACEALEQATQWSQLEARGTLRIAIKEAGYDPSGVNRPQLLAVIFHSLPAELTSRGLANAREICQGIADRLASS
jgi:hypothetical protein